MNDYFLKFLDIINTFTQNDKKELMNINITFCTKFNSIDISFKKKSKNKEAYKLYKLDLDEKKNIFNEIFNIDEIKKKFYPTFPFIASNIRREGIKQLNFSLFLIDKEDKIYFREPKIETISSQTDLCNLVMFAFLYYIAYINKEKIDDKKELEIIKDIKKTIEEIKKTKAINECLEKFSKNQFEKKFFLLKFVLLLIILIFFFFFNHKKKFLKK